MYKRKKCPYLEIGSVFDRAYISQQIEAGILSLKAYSALSLNFQAPPPQKKKKLLSVQRYLFAGIFLLYFVIHNNHLEN